MTYEEAIKKLQETLKKHFNDAGIDIRKVKKVKLVDEIGRTENGDYIYDISYELEDNE